MGRAFAVLMAGCAPGTTENVLTCEEVAHEVFQTLTDVAAAHQTCAVVEDCEVVWLSVTCAQSCSHVVGIGGVAAFEAALDEAEKGICADYPTCEPPVPPCLPPGPVDCVNGVCLEGT